MGKSLFEVLTKYNPNHDPKSGRFTSAENIPAAIEKLKTLKPRRSVWGTMHEVPWGKQTHDGISLADTAMRDTARWFADHGEEIGEIGIHRKYAKVQELPHDQLELRQPVITKQNVKQMLKHFDPSRQSMPATVYKINDRYVMQDGHHRVTRDWALGKTKSRLRVVDLDKIWAEKGIKWNWSTRDDWVHKHGRGEAPEWARKKHYDLNKGYPPPWPSTQYDVEGMPKYIAKYNPNHRLPGDEHGGEFAPKDNGQGGIEEEVRARDRDHALQLHRNLVKNLWGFQYGARMNGGAFEKKFGRKKAEAAQDALEEYISDSTEINGHLRRGTDPEDTLVQRQIRDIRYIAEHYTLPGKYILHRGVLGKGAEPLRNLVPGDVIQDKGFMSTSLSPQKAHTFATHEPDPIAAVIEIEARNPRAIPATHSGEAEIIFRPGQKLKIKDIRRVEVKNDDNSGTWYEVMLHIKAEALDE